MRESIVVMMITVIILTVTVVMVILASPARSNSNPAWDNMAGGANHACYTHKGVADITTPGYGSNGEDPTAVCRDGWAFDLYDLGFGQ